MAFKDIFKDENEYNEKTIIGFLSFTIMGVYSAVDLVTGYMGLDLPINDFVYNSFLYITCLLYTSPSPRDRQKSRMPSSA